MPPGRRHVVALALLALIVRAGLAGGLAGGRRGGRQPRLPRKAEAFGDVQVRGGACLETTTRSSGRRRCRLETAAAAGTAAPQPAATMLALRAFPLQPERLEATRKLLNNLERHWRLSPVATPRTRQLAELAALARSRVDSVRGRMPSVPGRKRFQYVSMPRLHIGETEEAAKTAAAYFATVRVGCRSGPSGGSCRLVHEGGNVPIFLLLVLHRHTKPCVATLLTPCAAREQGSHGGPS